MEWVGVVRSVERFGESAGCGVGQVVVSVEYGWRAILSSS